MRCPFGRRDNPVSDQVVHELAARRPGKAEIADLNRRRTARGNAHTREARPAFELDQHVELAAADRGRGFRVARPLEVDEIRIPLLELGAIGAAVVAAVAEQLHLEILRVVAAEEAAHQLHHRMIVEVA